MDIVPGTVYSKYKCGHTLLFGQSCIVTDKSRRYKKSGNFFRISACPICQTPEAHFMYSFKVCPDCGQLRTAKRGRLREGRCAVCGQAKFQRERVQKSQAKPKTCYQAGKIIEMPKKITTEPLCRHRTTCLPMIPRTVLHCGGCPHFEPETGADLAVPSQGPIYNDKPKKEALEVR